MAVFSALDSLTLALVDGTAASLVFVPRSGSTVTVAILGDAPVLVRQADGKWNVSPEHNVRTNHAERTEAERRGGVYQGGYIYHGNLGLQMSRALGDAPLRSILNRQPDIYQVEADGVFILATDGVFDPSHHNSEKEIAAVTRLIGEGATAKNIVDRAVMNQTGDNATAILVRMKNV
jgi:serine/threonine protein phosphatase PrpC